VWLSLPSFVEADEIRDAEVGTEVGEDEVVEDFEVSPDRVGDGYVFDKRDLFEDVASLVAFVIFEVELAFAKMIVGALNDLIHTRVSLLNFSLNLARGRTAGLGPDNRGNENGCGK